MHQFDSQALGAGHSNGIDARLEQRLTLLYGAERAPAIARRMRGIADRLCQQRVGPRLKAWLDETEVVLITYANTAQSPGARPLQTLNYSHPA